MPDQSPAVTEVCPKCHTNDCRSMWIGGELAESNTCRDRQLAAAQSELTTLRAERDAVTKLASRAYPGLKYSGFCSRHRDNGHYECSICYPNWQALIKEHMAVGDRFLARAESAEARNAELTTACSKALDCLDSMMDNASNWERYNEWREDVEAAKNLCRALVYPDAASNQPAVEGVMLPKQPILVPFDPAKSNPDIAGIWEIPAGRILMLLWRPCHIVSNRWAYETLYIARSIQRVKPATSADLLKCFQPYDYIDYTAHDCEQFCNEAIDYFTGKLGVHYCGEVEGVASMVPPPHP